MIIEARCPELKAVHSGFLPFADKNGIDFAKFGDAITNAILVLTNQPYDRDKLIPEVTLEVSSAGRQITSEWKTDPVKACQEWADRLIPLGLLKRAR